MCGLKMELNYLKMYYISRFASVFTLNVKNIQASNTNMFQQ